MDKNLRPPVVVVVGHVDHGKTSLLDAIRKTSVTKREAGGITQSIGASTVTTKNGNRITFLDTPGHALFKNMRQRGVNLADIGILVTATDDGVQPQTKEALTILQESQIPFIVALTKVDLPSSNIETTLQGLETNGVFFEKRGGDTPYVAVSSKTGDGIQETLDLISLISEVNEIKGDKEAELQGFVIETNKDKRGLMASVVVKNGTLKVGDTIFAGQNQAKVKGIFDENQKQIKEILPGFAGQVLGFSELPEAGSPISIAAQSLNANTTQEKQKTQNNIEAKLKIFVKAKTAGSLEALLANMPEGVQVVRSGVGDLTESDIFFAKSGNLTIYLFEAKYPNTIRKLAETEGIKIARYEIVYDLLDELKKIIEDGREITLGEAQIVTLFPFNGKKIAGCKIIKGIIKKGNSLKLIRLTKEIGKVKVISIRKQKAEVNEVKQGEECGILFAPQLDFASGDVLLSVES